MRCLSDAGEMTCGNAPALDEKRREPVREVSGDLKGGFVY
jgi:hypothetical protein